MGVNEEEDVVADGRTDEGVEAKDKRYELRRELCLLLFPHDNHNVNMLEGRR